MQDWRLPPLLANPLEGVHQSQACFLPSWLFAPTDVVIQTGRPNVPTDSENGNVQVWSFQCHVNIGIAPLYFHCFCRTAHFSTKKKFSGSSTGSSSWIKTSKRVTLTDGSNIFICIFSRSVGKRKAEKSSISLQPIGKVPGTERKPVQVRQNSNMDEHSNIFLSGSVSVESSQRMAQAALVGFKFNFKTGLISWWWSNVQIQLSNSISEQI